MQTFTFPIPGILHGPALTAEVRAIDGTVAVDPEEKVLRVTVPDGVTEAQARAVIRAHKGQPTQEEAQAEARRARREELRRKATLTPAEQHEALKLLLDGG